MTKALSISEQRIEQALEHDFRRQIVRWQARRIGPSSAKLISEQFERPLSTVTYHIQVLHRAKLLAQTDRVRVRWGIQCFYRVDPETARHPLVAKILDFAA